MIRITLSDAERSELAERLRDPRISVDTQARLRMAELSDQGLSPPRIAERVTRHENTVRKFLKRFQAVRLVALAKRTAPGRTPRVREEHWLALEAMLDGSARAFTSRQMAAWLQERFSLSVHPRYLAQRLRKRGWRYKRTKSSLAHREPEQATLDARRAELASPKKAGAGR